MEKYEAYDQICGIAMYNIYAATKDEPNVCIKNFDPDNMVHRFFFIQARNIAYINGKDVVFDSNWFKRMSFHRKYPKLIGKLARGRKNQSCIDFNILENDMLPLARHITGDDKFSFINVFMEYYNEL